MNIIKKIFKRKRKIRLVGVQAEIEYLESIINKLMQKGLSEFSLNFYCDDLRKLKSKEARLKELIK